MLALVLEGLSHWVLVEIQIADKVLTLIAPISDDAFVCELKTTTLLPPVSVVLRIHLLQLKHALKTACCRHKLEDGVDYKRAAELALKCRGFETGENPDFTALKLDHRLGIEKPWDFPDLLQISLSESLLNDDVDHRLADSVLRIFKLVVKRQ